MPRKENPAAYGSFDSNAEAQEVTLPCPHAAGGEVSFLYHPRSPGILSKLNSSILHLSARRAGLPSPGSHEICTVKFKAGLEAISYFCANGHPHNLLPSLLNLLLPHRESFRDRKLKKYINKCRLFCPSKRVGKFLLAASLNLCCKLS